MTRSPAHHLAPAFAAILFVWLNLVGSASAAEPFAIESPEVNLGKATYDSLGNTYLVGNDGSNAYLVKIGADGRTIYRKKALANLNTANSITIGKISDNNVLREYLFVLGTSGSGTYVRAYDRNGDPVGGSSNQLSSTDLAFRARDIEYFADRDPVSGTFTPLLYVCGETTTQMTVKKLLVDSSGNSLTVDPSAFAFGYLGGAYEDRAHALTIDDAGNVYVAGHFSTGTIKEGALGVWAQVVWDFDGFWGLPFALPDEWPWLDMAAYAGSFDASVFAAWSEITSTPVTSIDFDDSTRPASGQFVSNYKGNFSVQTAGVYTFYIDSDDGFALLINGLPVLIEPARGVYTNVTTASLLDNNPVTLPAGSHSIEFLHYEAGGAAKAKVQVQGPDDTSPRLLEAPTLGTPKPDAPYILKLSGNLSAINVYSPDDVVGSYNDVAFGDGWIYATGTVDDNGRTLTINNNDRTLIKDTEIVRVDPEFTDWTSAYVMKTRAAPVAGTEALIEGLGIAADEDGNVYVTGTFGSAATSFLSAGSDETRPSEFRRVASSGSSRYVAKLGDDMSFSWVWEPGANIPTFGGGFSNTSVRNDLHGVLWHEPLNRLVWHGSIQSGQFTITDGEVSKTVTGPGGLVTVFEPNSDLSLRANLSVGSEYGDSGTHVRPFAGNPSTPASDLFLVGVELTVDAEPFIYERFDSSGAYDPIPRPTQQNIETEAVVRRRSIGYIIDDVVTTTGKQSHTFILDRDKKIDFLWETDYALDIESDLSATLAADGSSLESGATGRPVPDAGRKHWFAEEEEVAPEIDTAIGGFTPDGGRLRFLVWGYEATGAADPANTVGTTPFQPGSEGDLRRKITKFAMTGPATLTWKWKRQYAVQLSTSGASTASFPIVHQIVSPPDITTNPPFDLTASINDRSGSDALFFDAGTPVFIGTRFRDSNGQFQLQGWDLGDEEIFALQGDISDLDRALIDGVDYRGRLIGNLSAPVRAQWLYNEPRFFEEVTIGSPVKFTGVTDPLVLAAIDPTTKPEVQLIDGPFGSTAEDMFVWDEVSGAAFPVRPGILRTIWRRIDIPDARVTVDVTISFDQNTSDYYPHIASTPPVDIDVPNNGLALFSVPFQTGDGAVNPPVDPSSPGGDNITHEFTATQEGRTVLVYRWKAGNASDFPEGSLRVRVVETDLWDDELKFGSATVAGRVTSPYDEAGLGTGYMFFPRSRFNASLHDRDLVQGPIFPVNVEYTSDESDDFVVVWYTVRDNIVWPHQAVIYDVQWPSNANRIVIASEFGSESAPAGSDPDAQQKILEALTATDPETGLSTSFPDVFTFDPSRLQAVSVYNQPDPLLPGYNPNEEHALVAPSLRFADVAPRPVAAYALRDGDLNITSPNAAYTSDPFVLLQFLDVADGQFKMAAFQIVRDDPTLGYTFEKEMLAGEPVIPFYPIGVVNGATPCEESFGLDGRPSEQQVYWEDHRGNSYAISAGRYASDGSPVYFDSFFFYRMLPEFAWPPASPAAQTIGPRPASDCVAFLTRAAGQEYPQTKPKPTSAGEYENPLPVRYFVDWPDEIPVLKAGESITYSGGEYRADRPTTEVPDGEGGVTTVPTPGLPSVVGWASGKIVFDTLNPSADPVLGRTRFTARLYPALSARSVALDVSRFPIPLRPANGRTRVDGGKYVFNELPASIQRRVTYDPLDGKLTMIGILNDKTIGDSTLTASPGAVYALEPNIMTEDERDHLVALARDSSAWVSAVNRLYKLTRNPNLIDSNFNDGGNLVQTFRDFVARSGGSQQPVSLGEADSGYLVGLQQEVLINNQKVVKVTDPFGIDVSVRDPSIAVPHNALGPGIAVSTNPDFLNPNDTTLPDVSYITLVENDDPSLAGNPVTLHVVKVDRRERYRGAIKVIYSDNVFDETVTLRHSGDFGSFADDLVFEWWYRIADGSDFPPPERAGTPNPWKIYPDPTGKRGAALFSLTVQGTPNAPEALLADSLWFVRYRHKNEPPGDVVSWDLLVDKNDDPAWQWAGAGNSTPQDQDGDGFPDYRAQLVFGWVKRVLDGINPYETRIRDFSGDAPATYVDIIRQLGQRYEGPVALNPDKNVIENVGLIELYGTVLDRARSLSIDLSTPVSTDGITIALQLAATRLSDFYQLLGDEAYVDALDPTIGHGSSSAAYGHLAPAIHAFQNQTTSLLTEELSLLRGVDDFLGRPVYNRLIWNFTKGEGEAAYATNYDLFDADRDGFVDEDDGQIIFPQGHGDAWGHYLTALRGQYDLLRHPFFNWVSRSEQYALNDVVFNVDFLDERKFAQAAAKKAKAGAQIVDLTHRQNHSEDPVAQWRGYTDNDEDRAWGVEGWARRAGMGAYVDWVTSNALLPAIHPNTELEGIRKIDRTTNEDIPVISANLNYIQQVFDDANNGYNPLGLAGDTVPFDISAEQLSRFFASGNSHFEQIYARALTALKNAKATFDHANQADNLLRKVGSSSEDFARSVSGQDASLRNQLIDFFGSPYPGTVGAGQAYPEGYVGPDTMLYMYAETRELNNETVPGQSVYFLGDLDNFDPSNLAPSSSSGFADDVAFLNNNVAAFPQTPNSFRQRYSASYAGTNLTDVLSNVSGNFEISYTDLDPNNRRLALANLTFPVTAAGYSFQAPPAWGKRPHYGKLQVQIQKMVQKETDLALALAAYDAFLGELSRQLRLVDAKTELDQITRNLNITDVALGQAAAASQLALGIAGGTAGFAGDLIGDVAEAVQEGFPQSTPIGGLAVSPGDVFAPVRSGVLGAPLTGKYALKATALSLSKASEIIGFLDQLKSAILGITIEELNRDLGTKGELIGLENMIGDDPVLRMKIFKEIEALRQLADEYRTILSQAQRVLDQREAFNKKVASLVQRERYQDMTFRVSRNAALQNYHEAFEIAARYSYLAAKAYDYETNLEPTDPASPRPLLEEIIGARTIGLVSGGIPQVGAGGLADSLARLKANYDVLSPRLGFNNPQGETGRFSLRREHFRLQDASDTAWSSQLQSHIVEDLWSVPEFRRYCRPFAGEKDDAGNHLPQPGIIIDFDSSVVAGFNFFGEPLLGGDSAYDPTNFATKIRSVGVWFENYDNTRLGETPRVYLIPSGIDILSIPTSNTLEIRQWSVLDQTVPVPFPSIDSLLDDPSFRPSTGSLLEPEGTFRRFSSFRAYGFTPDAGGEIDEGQMTWDSRLVGRSVWNTRWQLVIPGLLLNEDALEGVYTFSKGTRLPGQENASPRDALRDPAGAVKDIRLFFKTFGYSGN